jgi:quercetin dioxygenase-like cupin family protein
MELEPRKPTVKGPPEWFTGDVYIDAVARGHGASPLTIGLVHFTPGSRTAWHSHSLGQTLYVTEGQGRVQTRGEPVVTIGPGDVVFTPGDEWHWHGAAPDHVMTHLAVSEGDIEWSDPVTDAEYDGSG